MKNEVRPIDANALKLKIREYMSDYKGSPTRLAACRAVLSMLGDEGQTPTLTDHFRDPTKRAQQDTAWISVKDWLPDGDEQVLCIVSGKPKSNITLDGAVELADYSRTDGWIVETWPEWEDLKVTYWMPLPEPPEEG